MPIRTPAHIRYPKGVLWWLRLADEWSARTGIDLGTLLDHEMPCTDCDGLMDLRDLGSVADHEHRGLDVPHGIHMGAPVIPPEDLA